MSFNDLSYAIFKLMCFCRVEDSLVCESNETNTDTVVSIEEGVKDMGQRMEVGLHIPYLRTIIIIIYCIAGNIGGN